MVSEKMQAAFCDQINRELYSEYLYLSMVAYFDDLGLKGFAHWMRVQTKEEHTHAMMMFTHLGTAGGKVTLQPIAGPPTTFESPLAVFEATLEHERFITANINALLDQALGERDHASAAFLQWFVTEQVEEEAAAKELVDTLRLIGGQGQGLLMLDRELGARVFNLPAAAAAMGIL
jgi:ferritin